jgi:hypothetical protein
MSMRTGIECRMTIDQVPELKVALRQIRVPRNFFFHVAPRYTCGSPALVREEIARQVAEEEVRFYNRLIEHPEMCPQDTELAKLAGLSRIAWASHQKGNKMEVIDIITGEEYEIPIKEWGGYFYARTDLAKFVLPEYRRRNRCEHEF